MSIRLTDAGVFVNGERINIAGNEVLCAEGPQVHGTEPHERHFSEGFLEEFSIGFHVTPEVVVPVNAEAVRQINAESPDDPPFEDLRPVGCMDYPLAWFEERHTIEIFGDALAEPRVFVDALVLPTSTAETLIFQRGNGAPSVPSEVWGIEDPVRDFRIDGQIISPQIERSPDAALESIADKIDRLQSGLDDALLDGLVGLGIEEAEVDRDMAVGIASNRYHDERYEQPRPQDGTHDQGAGYPGFMEQIQATFARRIGEEITRGQEGREPAGVTADEVLAVANAIASRTQERSAPAPGSEAAIRQELERRFVGRPIVNLVEFRQEVEAILREIVPVAFDVSQVSVIIDRENGALNIDFGRQAWNRIG